MRNIYARKQQFLTDCIKNEFGENAAIYGDKAGLNVVLQVKSRFDEPELIDRALEKGVKVYPVSFYYFDKDNYKKHNMVLMGYGHLSFEEIRNGIRFLKKSLVLS